MWQRADLPEFDAEDPVWADLLWSAAHRGDTQSIAALADHCRRHDAGPVLRWLAGGPGAYRWVAGRLLVEGVPAADEHTTAFVAGLGHALRGDLTMTRWPRRSSSTWRPVPASRRCGSCWAPPCTTRRGTG
ncbi:MAG: hypothetical protein M3422_20175, partial [Actinomycetota bacterium]|nr:hypothetical protein [Actinomycetota bacterium]